MARHGKTPEKASEILLWFVGSGVRRFGSSSVREFVGSSVRGFGRPLFADRPTCSAVSATTRLSATGGAWPNRRTPRTHEPYEPYEPYEPTNLLPFRHDQPH